MAIPGISFDLSVILTAHNETLVSGPTVKSAEDAIRAAMASGYSVERIVALDTPTEETQEWFFQSRMANWRKISFSEGDLGRTRNAAVRLAKGRCIAFLDADDLFSQNWLSAGMNRLQQAEKAGQRAIVHPELNWLFDGAHSVFFKPDQTDPLFSPYHFYCMNYYDSLCLAPREAHLEHTYSERIIPAGLSFQDWQFAIESMAGGWLHLNAPDTIIFKRRRGSSLVTESRARKAVVRQLEPMAVDRVADLGACGHMVDPTERAQADAADHSAKVPYYGARFAARVERARAHKGRVSWRNRRVYKVIKPEFDHAFYLASYPDIAALEHFDPVAHFVRAGWKECRNPTPWFSTRSYLQKYPDVARSGANPFSHWLEKGRYNGYVPRPVDEFETIAEMLGCSAGDAFTLWRSRYDDLRQRLEHGGLGAQVAHAALHEPLIEQGWMQALKVKVPPFNSDIVSARTAAMWRLNGAAGHRRTRYVICVNRPRFGAAPRFEGHIARALAGANASEVLVVLTEHSGTMPEGKLPKGVRVVDFAALTTGLKKDAQMRVLTEFLRALRPECVFNVNSRLLWDAMIPYGTALASSVRIFACLFCNEQTAHGYWTGYPLRRVYPHFHQLAGILTDSQFLADELRERHMLPRRLAGRVQALPSPADSSIPVMPLRPTVAKRRPQIFWAGRIDPQKRAELVYEIASALPEVDFRMWGASVLKGGAPLPDRPANVYLEGVYDHFTSLPLEEADAWLYTSAWDGVPVQLLEAAMTGIPLVGSDAGGTREVLLPALTHCLPKDASTEQWAVVIRKVLADPENARAKALKLRDILLRERTESAHAAALVAAISAEPPDATKARGYA
ncbi:glycosyltransferase [Ruegeria sp. 2012CJ41-6]|uniref:Glycosyltransferase n=1 Tax=Ruegeria spongiae TaxID=2942209 RepID=A0ABT0Q874_9RHOB|nr:glycosyltransferase [Ruegeria spongiae]MCL6285617.1 glycosyltransferase [Ruegeria spongiae]